jgi:protein SCO1
MKPGRVQRSAWTTLLALALCGSGAAAGTLDRAIDLSQAALGNELPELEFIDSDGQTRWLSEYRGQPILVSLIFTGCVHSCSVATRHTDRMVRIARDAVGSDSFTVLTIGFDYPVDQPSSMRDFARRHGITDPRWHFLSARDEGDVTTLTRALGFYFERSARGFDHTMQLTVLDGSGRIYRQIYGETFPAPLLVEPLKDLIWRRTVPEATLGQRVANRIRLICTVYDPKSDRYYYDYSLYAGLLIGVLVLGTVLSWLLVEYRRRHQQGFV